MRTASQAVSGGYSVTMSTTSCTTDAVASSNDRKVGTLLHVIDVLEGILGDIGTASGDRKKVATALPVDENPGANNSSDDDSYDDTPSSRQHSSVSDEESAENMSVDAEGNNEGERDSGRRTHALLLRQQLEDLASVDPGALRRQLHPVLKALGRLDSEVTLGLERTTESWMGPVRIDDEVKVVPIHELISPRQYGKMAGCVRYLHMTERQNLYSIGVFVFPPGASIPLHDHPDMAVLSRVLYGEVTARSFDEVDETSENGHQSTGANNSDSAMNDVHDDHDESSTSLGRSMLGRTGSWFSSLLRRSSLALSASVASSGQRARPRGSKRATMNDTDRILRAPATTMLLPREGNIHQFTAGPDGAAVLDVLLPPYDFENERDCTFYRVEPDSSMSTHEDGRGSRYWLIPTEQPKDFHCISGSFGDVGVTDEG